MRIASANAALYPELESAEFSVVSNLLLTREWAELADNSRFTNLLGDFLADSSNFGNFGTIAKFAVTPGGTQNTGISASGFSEQRGTLEPELGLMEIDLCRIWGQD